MKAYLKATLFVAVGLLSTQAAAAVFQLTFEGLQNQEQVQEFYNGGTGSLGSSGPNYGVSFSSSGLALIDSDAGGSGSFANEPSASTIVFWQAGPSVVMNVAAGFTTGFSFYYSSSTAATVTVYDGLNATGNVLATINLSAQHTSACTGDPSGTYCNWDQAGASFSGTARSVDFSGTAGQTGYDNITFGSATPNASVESVPTLSESGLILLAMTVGVLGFTYQRRRAGT